MTFVVELVDRCTPDVVDAFCRYEPRLSSRPSPLKPEVLARMVESHAYQLLVARNDGVIRATLTAAVYQALRGVTARIDDVVAEQDQEGQAAAVALVEEAIRRAGVGGADSVQLVSKPALPVANGTYERLGFVQEGPGLYRRAIPGRS
ncbi:GNAT family N-acetyltransferase [Dactylosporangium siamense]|uniref:GNAT family N-acetyltransferase n=1 Tax=Dactylosporangium siamense TaxID=685454 RepID=UPI0019435E55|nr:GNAT family N-acetyltransferase [Dactylosporangium siamense]